MGVDVQRQVDPACSEFSQVWCRDIDAAIPVVQKEAAEEIDGESLAE